MEDAMVMRITLKQRLSVKQIAVHHVLLQKVITINVIEQFSLECQK